MSKKEESRLQLQIQLDMYDEADQALSHVNAFLQGVRVGIQVSPLSVDNNAMSACEKAISKLEVASKAITYAYRRAQE